jgi:phosphohistidine phosphatase
MRRTLRPVLGGWCEKACAAGKMGAMTAESGPLHVIVMRHAKSEDAAASDHARQLTDEGRTDAQAAGRWLAETGLVPNVVLVSSATRAVQTAEQLARGLGSGEPAVHVLDALYQADVDEVLQLVAEAPVTAGTVMVIGHNPTMAQLVGVVDARETDAAPRLPSAGVVVVDFADRASFGPGTGTIVDSHAPGG